jgi:hypothetical protein
VAICPKVDLLVFASPLFHLSKMLIGGNYNMQVCSNCFRAWQVGGLTVAVVRALIAASLLFYHLSGIIPQL